ncbi:MAG TPA: group 1 glycosyl transferase [Cyanobacteria bacterium UBA8530]|nr:group 1 glycosyl transferase [Cyanobacteria bacterium UBA8530]
MKAARVLIIEPVLKHYRLSFYEQLHETLLKEGISLRVAYGDLTPGSSVANNTVLDPRIGFQVKNRWFCKRLLYQAVWPEVKEADLVIVDQALKHLNNHFLVLLSRLGLKKVAYWGHGRNRQSKEGSLAEWFKSKTLARVDWWFAYSEGTADYLLSRKVPKEIITNVQNAVDTSRFSREVEGISEKEKARLLSDLSLPKEAIVGLYCGSLYDNKRIDFLIETAVLLKKKLPSFFLLVIGDGPKENNGGPVTSQRPLIEEAARRHSWIRYLGPKFGQEKAAYFALAQAFLHPGAVGLAILDSFAAGLPFFTTDIPLHGPEIEYLRNQENGLLLPDDAGAFSEGVLEALLDEERRSKLHLGARAAGKNLTLDKMVDNFKNGVLSCLGGIA